MKPSRIIDWLRANVRSNYQNLNERPGDKWGNASGPGILHGRAWLHLLDNQAGRRGITIHPSWHLWSRFCHAYLRFDHHDADLSVSVAVPPVAFWLDIEGVLPRKFKQYGWGRVTGVSLFDWNLRLEVWADDSCWNSKDRWWQSRTWRLDIVDTIFGRCTHSDRDLDETEVTISMPEGHYPATVRRFESTWKRPRWPWPWHRAVRSEVKPTEMAIPVPGKGENSWDCGEDARYGSTSPADTVAKAIGNFVEGIWHDRLRRAGPAWVPKEKHPMNPPVPPGGHPVEQCCDASR